MPKGFNKVHGKDEFQNAELLDSLLARTPSTSNSEQKGDNDFLH